MKKLLSLFAITLVLAACGTSKSKNATSKTKTPADPTKYAETITAEDLKTALYIYAGDAFEGRETGKEGQKMAVEFIKEHYIEDGIPAAKSDGNYFQDVPLVVMAVPDVKLSINGKSFTNVEDYVSVSSSKDAILNAKDVVFAGYGIEDENYSNYKDLDVKGKVVVIRSGEPKNADGNYVISGTSESSKWSNMRQAFASKQEVAKSKGAKALLFYYPEVYTMAANRYGRSSGRMNLADGAEDMMYMLINTDLAKALVSDIDTNENSMSVKSDVAITYKNNSENVSSENVAAIIKGSEKPNEYIIISAHLDHEGIKDGKVYNGADDDGSGTVAILEIAEAFAKAKKDGHGPKRSIVFLNVTGEEKGLLGSRHYTDNDPIFPLADTVADLNIDMIGRTDPKREKKNRNYVYLIGSDRLSTELHDISEAMNTKYMNIDLDYTFNDENDPNRYYFRSDHYNFAKNNIPVIFYFNGTHDDYHQPGDTPDKIQYDLLENRTRLVFYTAWELANREARITVDKVLE
ncbi:M28 family peptidase [Lacinutrix sp. Bg11-31]|uniref:M28 family peptidase n=1 Tax=Lacinutrix sp. Bg11-31 TaxID=2057808 RepID=UPI000C303694|nr:M28 family peptidase [Lacinutrix sp. Bg11-31]AUC81098.1 peptidase [Lacinutrix sp. Bg11-31]